jgi:hypothetical protein
VWVCMGVYGCVWVCVGVCGCVWVCVFGPLGRLPSRLSV